MCGAIPRLPQYVLVKHRDNFTINLPGLILSLKPGCCYGEVSMTFLTRCGQMLAQFLKIDHDRFLPHPFQFIIRNRSRIRRMNYALFNGAETTFLIFPRLNGVLYVR
jgi:hypothetical protein